MRQKIYFPLIVLITATVIGYRPSPSPAFKKAIEAARMAAAEGSKSFIGGIAGGTGVAGFVIPHMKPQEESKVLIEKEEIKVNKREYLGQIRRVCYAQENEHPEKCIQIANENFKRFCIENCKLDE